jgi:HSP20 family protein
MVQKGKKKKTEKVAVKKKNKDDQAMIDYEQTREWQPFDLFRKFEEHMEEMVKDFEMRYYFPKRYRGHGGYSFPAVRQPLLDIENKGKNLIVLAELPGIPKENIDIRVTERSIEISAKAQLEKKDEGKDYYHHERSYQSYYRNIPLPAAIDHKKADAELKDGLLKVTLPKKNEESLKKKINKVRVK